MAGALDAAHAHGLVHRDVKPTNVLIAYRDGGEHAFLTDFGLTKRREAEEGLTRPGFAMGTADYMAPEQARGDSVDGRADVYALACVLFKSLTGTAPFDRESDLEKMLAHLRDPPPSLLDARPDLPAALDEALRRALAKDRRDRPESAGAFAREVLDAIGDAAGRGAGALRRDARRRRRGLRAAARGRRAPARGGRASTSWPRRATPRSCWPRSAPHRPDVAITDIRMPPTQTDEGLRAARDDPRRAARHRRRRALPVRRGGLRDRAAGRQRGGRRLPAQGPRRRPEWASPTPSARSARAARRSTPRSSPRCSTAGGRRARSTRSATRQRDVLAQMAEGQSNQAIARGLDVTERAVERDVSTIFAKLGLPAGSDGHRRVLAVLTYLRA